MTYRSIVTELGQLGPYKLGVESSTGVKLLGKTHRVYREQDFWTPPGGISLGRDFFFLLVK